MRHSAAWGKTLVGADWACLHMCRSKPVCRGWEILGMQGSGSAGNSHVRVVSSMAHEMMAAEVPSLLHASSHSTRLR
jgi:hypothetical protein